MGYHSFRSTKPQRAPRQTDFRYTCPISNTTQDDYSRRRLATAQETMLPYSSNQTLPTPSAHDFREDKSSDRLRLAMGSGKPFPGHLPDAEAFVVEFDGENDLWKPHNWRSWTKFHTSLIVCYGTFVASFDSALFAAGSTQASKEFSVSNEVGVLGTTLFVLGFAFGPLIWAPSSEFMGRRWPLCVGMIGCSIFNIGSAAAKDIQTLLVCRFFAGVFGASPLCIVPAVLADIYTNAHRGVAISIYALTVFGGPLTAPFVGGFISMSYLGWRWTLYLPAIMGFFDSLLLIVWLKETYHPNILIAKAVIIRRETGNWAVHARQEKVEPDFREIARKYFTRPLKMLATEPIVLAVSLYMSFIYGIVYALLEAYPYVFQDIHGMNQGVSGLPFIGLLMGLLFALLFILSQQGSYVRRLTANHNKPVPEWRLLPAMVGAFAFTAGLFWFAWTAYRADIHWMAPTASGVLIGFGVLCIFLPCFNYLVDAFLPLAASTVAANIILRSAVASVFPLFSQQMFKNLGIQWAGTLLACLAAIMIPLPVGLNVFGPSLRKRSKIIEEEYRLN